MYMQSIKLGGLVIGCQKLVTKLPGSATVLKLLTREENRHFKQYIHDKY